MSVTSIEQFKKYAGGSEVELPGFVSGENITVRLRRPSIMAMMADGIPNPLLGVAAEVFNGGLRSASQSADGLKSTGELMQVYARAALVEPTYEQLEQAGVQLTDDQLTAIYSYVLTGVDRLKRFREIQRDQPDTGTVKKVSKKTK